MSFHFWGKLELEDKKYFSKSLFGLSGFLTDASREHKGPGMGRISLLSNWGGERPAFLGDSVRKLRKWQAMRGVIVGDMGTIKNIQVFEKPQ